MNESVDFNKGIGGPDRREELAVSTSGRFPLRNVGQHDARPKDVFEREPGIRNRFRNNLKTAPRLTIDIVGTSDAAVGCDRSRTGYGNNLPHPYRSRKANPRLER